MKITIDNYNGEVINLSLGDSVYFMYNNEVKCSEIVEIKISDSKIIVLTKGNYGHRNIDKIFHTKQDLLNSL